MTRGPKIPCYPRYPCATTQARNASNLFLSNNKKSRLILSDKPKISRLVCIRKKAIHSPLFWRALKKMPIFGKTNKNAVSFYTCELFSDIQIPSSF